MIFVNNSRLFAHFFAAALEIFARFFVIAVIICNRFIRRKMSIFCSIEKSIEQVLLDCPICADSTKKTPVAVNIKI